MDVSVQKFVKDTQVVTRSVASETIIVPIASGVGDLDSIYTLNEVGTSIWRLVDGHRSTGEIAESIATEYEVTREEADRDIAAFLGELRDAGLVKYAVEG